MDRPAVTAQAWSLLFALAAAGAGIGAAVGLTLLAALVVSGLGIQVGLVAAVVFTLALTAGVAFGGVSALYLSVRGLGWSFVGIRVPTPRDLAWVGGGYLLAFLSVIVASVVVSGLGAEAAPNQLGELGLEAPELLLLLVPVSLLLIGPGEELLFRGVVQGTLRESFGPVAAVGLASAIFAGIHYLALTGGVGARLTTIVILFFPSLVFGAAYERTHNLVVSALIHGLYNSTLAVLLYAGLRFAGEAPALGGPW